MGVNEDLARIEYQEQSLWFDAFDPDVAWRLGGQLRAWAVHDGLRIVIDIRGFGQPLFYAALPGSVPDNADWVRRKGNIVARFHRSSYAMALRLSQKGATLAEKYGLAAADYAAAGGAFPIHVRAAGVIGSAAVSGLTDRADHELVVRAVCALLDRDYAGFALDNGGAG